MMRNFLAVLFFTLFLNACEKDIIKDSTDSAEKEIVINNESLIQGNIRIKVNEELATQIENARREDGSIINLQAKSVDDVILSSGVSSLIRTFPYAGKFEERTRKAGLHLWYDVVFDTSTPLTKAYNDFSKIPGVKEVELKREIVRYNNNPLDFIDVLDKISITANYSPQVAYPFDDPKLPDQWHYYNKGGTSVFLSGADINVFPVWRSYTTGSDEIIISVVDGGIDYFHEDLVDNIWINMAEYNGSSGVDDDGNGYKDDIYGYNFLTNSPEITPHNHGTHVAGIVAAVNNNGIGVSGVAGGNFKKNIKGARLMSCQIFSARPEDEDLKSNTAAAIKYGADNGAVISQNSWGYKETKIVPNSIKAAIDYFIEYAGVDEFGNQIGPMKGGLVIFAAGNNDNEDYAPANYEKVLSVASIGPDYAKASYSNFGSWVDISAPGGEYSKGRVLSTTPNNGYGYLQGTSMACPHVSGVAALVISKVGGEGFTNEMLWERLVDNTTDIYQHNSEIKGKLGSGLVNALGAIASYGTIPPEPVNDIWANSKSNNIFLKWLVTPDLDDGKAYGYSIYYSKKNLENLDIDNLNEVYENIVETYDLEVGDTLYATISGLEFETNYYFTIDAYDYSSNRSELASVINVKTKENTAPIINPLNGLKLTQKAFETKYLNFSFLDPDGHNVAWSLVPGSSAATASLVNNIIEVKIVGRDAPAGTYIGKIVVTDEYGASSYVEFVYKIEENQPPIVVNPLANIYISSLGKEVVLDVANVFEDPDGEPLTYIASSDAPTLVQVTQNLNSIVITSLSYGLANLTVLAKDALGATVESSFKVLVRNNSNEIDLYPNPVRDILNLRVGEETTAQVSLISGVGATVFNKQTNIGPFNPLQIDMSSMSGGVYTVIAKFGGKELKYNIIKL